jgi:acetate kinase
MAALLAARESDARADEAIRLFVYILRKHIGALAIMLGGLDLLVFTGGIGGHATAIRDEVVAGIAPLTPAVHVIETDENLMIARHTYRVMEDLFD